jgi:hypothetical protein
MELTYILVDFENVQPLDMGLLNGEHYQLRIFRGPHQKKLDFDIAESLQPHGNRVQYIQSDKHGKNALDFHIAFYMGRLIEELEANGSAACKNTRFVVITKDGGFDALMSHVQSLGYGAIKAASIRQALGLDESVTEAGNAIPLPVSQPPNKPPAVKNAAPVAKAPPVRPATTPKKSATAQAKPSKSPGKKPQTPARTSLEPADKEKVIEHLRLHPKNRPVKRKTLESHITSLVGGNVAAKAVRGLIADLESEAVIKFSDNKIVEYKIPKRKKK